MFFSGTSLAKSHPTVRLNKSLGDLDRIFLDPGESFSGSMYGPRSSSNQGHAYPRWLFQFKSQLGHFSPGYPGSLSCKHSSSRGREIFFKKDNERYQRRIRSVKKNKISSMVALRHGERVGKIKMILDKKKSPSKSKSWVPDPEIE
jgi:hypothetical protein